MGSPINDVFDGGRARSEADKAAAIGTDNARSMEGLRLPNIQWENYNPDDIKYQTISEDPNLRQSQMDVLKKMSGLSTTGESDQDALGFLQARQLGDQSARAGSEAAMQNAAARGVSGSGLEFANREIANQDGAQRAQAAALQQAANSSRQRALYTSAYGSALGQERSQDLAANSANTDIINKFNAQNTTNKNQAQQYNQEGTRNTAQQNFSNDLTRRQNIAGAYNQVAQNHLANSAASSQGSNALLGAAAGAGAAALTGGASAAAGAAKPPSGGGYQSALSGSIYDEKKT